MLVKPENLRGAANICSDSGKRPLAAMFGADETLQGGGLAIYCLFYNAEKRDIDGRHRSRRTVRWNISR